MKKLFIILLSLSALGSIFSCTTSKKDSIPLELKESQIQLILPIDDSTSNISDGLTYLPENKLLFNLNWIQNSIQIYDLNSRKKIKDLKFDYEGPFGVLDIMGILPYSTDSIFLFNQLEPEITLIDSSGKIKSKIRYQAPDNYSPAFIHNAYFSSPPILNGDNMIVKTHVYGPLQNMTQSELQEKDLVYEIDLKTGKTWFLDFKFPKDYMPEGLKLFEASIAKGADKYVYSLFGDHRLFFVEELGDSLKSVNGKSAYLPETFPLFPLQGDGLDFRKYSYYSPHYESLEYDPYREVFIRFAFHPFEQDENVSPSDMRNHSGPFSIQVFDKNLSLVSETPFPANKYHPFDYFITSEGIYISTSHPLNPEIKEDEMKFELLKFVKKKNNHEKSLSE